jgi:hypothetical protein
VYLRLWTKAGLDRRVCAHNGCGWRVSPNEISDAWIWYARLVHSRDRLKWEVRKVHLLIFFTFVVPFIEIPLT